MKIFQPKMSNSTSKTYKFDLVFLRRFFNLHNFFFPRLWSSNSALFGLLLLTSGLGKVLSNVSCAVINKITLFSTNVSHNKIHTKLFI